MSFNRNSFFIDGTKENKLKEEKKAVSSALIRFVIYDKHKNFTFIPEDQDIEKRQFSLKRTMVHLYVDDDRQIYNVNSLNKDTAAIFNSLGTNCKVDFYFP